MGVVLLLVLDRGVAAADWIAEKMRAIGLQNVQKEAFPVDTWDYKGATLKLTDDKETLLDVCGFAGVAGTEACGANLCIEHICDEYKKNDEGGISPTGQIESCIVFTTKGKRLNRIVQEEFIRHRMDRTLFMPANLLGDDLCTDADMFYQEGIEVCSMVSGPIYLYSSDDTLDKIPKDQLVPTCRTFSDILWRLMNDN